MQQPMPPAVHTLLASILALSPTITDAMFRVDFDDSDEDRKCFTPYVSVSFTDGTKWSTGPSPDAYARFMVDDPDGSLNALWQAIEETADDRADVRNALGPEDLSDGAEWTLTRDDVPVPFVPTDAAMAYLAARGKVDPQ